MSLALLLVASSFSHLALGQNATTGTVIPTKNKKPVLAINKVIAFAPAANVSFGDDIEAEGGEQPLAAWGITDWSYHICPRASEFQSLEGSSPCSHQSLHSLTPCSHARALT